MARTLNPFSIPTADELEQIPTDGEDAAHIYEVEGFEIPAGTKSLCGIVAKHNLIHDGGAGAEDGVRECPICKREYESRQEEGDGSQM